MTCRRRLGPLLPWTISAALCTLSLAIAAPAAGASDRAMPIHPSVSLHGGKSPFKLAGSAAHGIISRHQAHAKRLTSPLASPLAAPCTASCSGPLLYWGGQVMRKEKLYLIEWEPTEPSNNGQAGTTFEPLPAEYMKEVGTFLADVAAESGKLGNVYSVDTLYGEPKVPSAGEYSASFGGEYLDTKDYPSRNATYCPESTEPGLPAAGQPCISDSEGALQLGTEVAKFVEANHLPTGLEAIYFVLMPHRVNSCSGFEGEVAACSTNSYCAYHTAVSSNGKDIVYANMPYDDVEGCETPDEPHGTAADDEINTLSHENNEAVTDPLGNAWFDYSGEEVADKCTYPHFDPISDFNPEEDDYGPLIGGTTKAEYRTVVSGGIEYLELTKPGNSYNEEINGGHFLLQREWSNAAGGCVQHAPKVAASFTVTQQSETELTFNGGPSTTEAGQITEYQWEFSDEPGVAHAGEEVKHTFASTGEYAVKLMARNDSGEVGTSEQKVVLKAGSGGSVTSTTTTTATKTEPVVTSTKTEPAVTSTSTRVSSVTATTTALLLTSVTTTRTVSVPVEAEISRYTPKAIEALLGLPRNGAKLSGLGTVTLGHAQCPPACGVKVRLTASTRRGKHVKRVEIGSLNETVASKGTRSIALRLTRKGRALLRKSRRGLHVMASIEVEGREGATWTITRSLTLTRGGKAAASRRRHRGHLHGR